MPMKHRQSNSQRGFDAVAESRRWKEVVAAETAGMSIRERMAWFRRQSSVPAIREQSQSNAAKRCCGKSLPHTASATHDAAGMGSYEWYQSFEMHNFSITFFAMNHGDQSSCMITFLWSIP